VVVVVDVVVVPVVVVDVVVVPVVVVDVVVVDGTVVVVDVVVTITGQLSIKIASPIVIVSISDV
jgi:hypothetical protein